MRSTSIAVLVVIVFLLLGLGFVYFRSPAVPGTSLITPTLIPTPTTLFMTVTPAVSPVISPISSAGTPTTGTLPAVTVRMVDQNTSGQSGSAVLTAMGGQTRVVINIAAGPSGIPQPAHIHVGACPNPGAVKYPLSSVVDGVSETTLNVSLSQLSAQLPLAVNVHQSAAQINTYVSCGNISF